MSIVIEHFRELFRCRVLIESLVWREVKARYRGSILGYLWTLLNPLLLLVVYRLVFTIYTHGVDLQNYSVFIFVGILPWLWLSSSVGAGTTCIATGGSLITRICMPPQILPAVQVLSNLVNFLLALPVAVIAAALYGIHPTPALALLPAVMLVELAFVYGLTLLVATLTVRFRDVQFLVQNLIMFWFFMTPIAYPLTIVPERFRVLLVANPATPVILPYQDMLYAQKFPSALYLLGGAAWALIAVFVAVRVFEAMRSTLAEEI